MIGSYCHHFHHINVCPECKFEGIAVNKSVNKAFSIHGTSKTNVSHNVVHNHRGASIYLENGQEYGNLISHNMITCEYMSSGYYGKCSLRDSVPSQGDSDFGEQSGIYALSSFNDIIGNRVSGQDNAFYINQQGVLFMAKTYRTVKLQQT